MDDDTGNEKRLSRWSQRKLAVAREDALEKEVEAVEITSPEEQSEEEARLQAELQANREAAEAVDLETMDEESDFSVFMKAGVPDMLKKQAMASLWRTSPVFANVDGLVDYDDDFASPDLIMKTFKSAYQAGKGYLDLFKEDEEPDNEDAADTAEEKQLASESEVEEESENSGEDTQEIEEKTDDLLVLENEASNDPIEEPVPMEEEPMPKVSLRKRLELERET